MHKGWEIKKIPNPILVAKEDPNFEGKFLPLVAEVFIHYMQFLCGVSLQDVQMCLKKCISNMIDEYTIPLVYIVHANAKLHCKLNWLPKNSWFSSPLSLAVVAKGR